MPFMVHFLDRTASAAAGHEVIMRPVRTVEDLIRSGIPITAETRDAAALRAVLGTPASQLGAAIRWAARYLEG